MEFHVVKVTILGRKLSIRTDARPEDLAATLAFIEKRAESLKSTSFASDPANLSLLLNIVLADELQKTQQELTRLRQNELAELEQADKLANELIQLISSEIDVDR